MLTQGGSLELMRTPYMAARLPTIVQRQRPTKLLGHPNTARAFFGLDRNLGQCKTEDVRSQPRDDDPEYAADDPSGHVADLAAVICYLL